MNNSSGYEHLLALAARQRGYFAVHQALTMGVSRRTIQYWRSKNRFVPVLRGIYRLFGYYQQGLIDDVWPVWLASGQDTIVSHESALVLYDLSDLMPNTIHLSVSYQRRGRHYPSEVRIHTFTKEIPKSEITYHEGIPVTQIERTIIDCVASHVQRDQVQLACHQAVERGLTTSTRLLEAAANRSQASVKMIKPFLVI